MKKIAYIEIDTHSEVASNFIQLMHGSNEYDVHYFFSKKIKDQLEISGKNIHLCDSSTLLSLLKQQNFDFVIIGTVHRYFNVWMKVVEMYRTAIIVHNLNFAKATSFQLFRAAFLWDQLFRFKLWWKEAMFLSPKVYSKAEKWVVLDDSLKKDSKTNYLPIFFTEILEKNISNQLCIVIPGNVSQNRRDYQHVFNIIRKNISSFSNQFQFVFLGKAEGKELRELKILKKEVSEYCEIIYFKDKLSSKDFNKYLSNASVLWCPIVKNGSFMSRLEVYGKTKMTGNIGDAIKFGKLAVFPADYETDLPFIINEKSNVLQLFVELQNMNFDFDKKYSKNSISELLEQALDKMIDI